MLNPLRLHATQTILFQCTALRSPMLMTTVITITYRQDEKLVFRTYAGKKQSSQSSIHNFQNPVLDEDAEDAEDDQDD